MDTFVIDISQDRLDDLRARLARTRWPDALDGVGWSYGVPPEAVRELAAYWLDGYSWRAHEARLNELPQYTTRIDGQLVHFAHVRSARPGALPLVLTHGWPSTFADFSRVAGPLSRDFHLVIPSVPGFACSGPATEPGWGVRRVAAAWAELMDRLGYDRYGAHGGDLGALVSPALARLAPDRVVGVHVNALTTFVTDDMSGLTEAEVARARGIERWRTEFSGYAAVQGTRPQTLAYALADSPAGLLAWTLDVFASWGRDAGGVPADDLLTDVSLAWLTGTAGSSTRIYRESGADWAPPATPGSTPTGVAVFPGDNTVRRYAERAHNVVHWSEFPRGGHHAALQAPALLADDIRTFFSSL
ncbi:epoxide hydrolase family protein [Nonomuraea jiangxiensis]|uniref:Pimeloyl-ACP methyl ester carboxylesterase n=1 Tax=Nonomuraea jiangxiensis TaxID=633440 RepID=A0A1G8K9K3_9ACTN|nr:epoxide hydrolase family protein [Nonomuraea jiangxiensis]SDI40156.1 Pimeloyl-ACP methyl ester carboxylesterase [Nonomuraea jiangxiensis]